MAATRSQEHTDCSNVRMDLEDVEEDKAIKESKEREPNQLLNTGHSQDPLGPRQRKLTEKGQEEKVRRLKNDQTAKLTAVSKQRNAPTGLMESENNLHLSNQSLMY